VLNAGLIIFLFSLKSRLNFGFFFEVIRFNLLIGDRHRAGVELLMLFELIRISLGEER
jgi:hypothetical protein